MINDQIIYASTIMNVTCPHCGAMGKVRANVPPKKDFAVLCPGCKERFVVKVNIRQYYRKEASIPVHCFLPSPDMAGMKDLGEGTITDISMGGICVRVHENAFRIDYFSKGRTLMFIFSLPPRNESLKVSGEIVRLSKEEDKNYVNVGVKFYSLGKFAEKQIGFFLLP